MSDASLHPPVPAPPPPPSNSPAQPQVPPTPGPLRGRRWLPLVLVSAIIGGGLGVFGSFLVMRSDAGQDDAAIVCNQLEQINFPLDGDELDLDGPLIFRLFSISGFASAAGFDDDASAGFKRPGQELVAGITRIDVDLINESLEQLSVVCGEIGH